jgi:ubiquinone/menaquinone biosynthesis C-methylase UbiE
MTRTLTHAQAKAFYDRFGRAQDWQAFYEDEAVRAMIAASELERARAIVELGCGTGRLAASLLEATTASYLGLDVSDTMVSLARERLAPFGVRAQVQASEGGMKLPLATGSCDRVLSAYVLDLLSEDDIRAFVGETHRVLEPGGRLCLTSLTHGQGPASRLICRLWTSVHALRPQLMGGCRPLALAPFLDARFRVLTRRVICRYALCSEVLVAERGV